MIDPNNLPPELVEWLFKVGMELGKRGIKEGSKFAVSEVDKALGPPSKRVEADLNRLQMLPT